MSLKFSKLWIEDRQQVTEVIKQMFDESGSSSRFLLDLDENVTLFREGDVLDEIYILLEGAVDLYKRKPNTKHDYPIVRLESGSLIGIIAYTTGKPSLTTAKTAAACTVLKIPEEEIRVVLERNEKMKEYIDEVILANLLERFQNTIILQMKLDSVNNKLKEERNELRKAYRDLKEAQDQLVYQEKMATLGQLVSGFAHEVNNPTASLVRSSETLEQRISELIDRSSEDETVNQFARRLYEAGKESRYPDTASIREKSAKLRRRFEFAGASNIRIMAQIPDDLIGELEQFSDGNSEDLQYFLNYFELGRMFQNIGSAGHRISSLVKSLKSYSRSDTDRAWEETDIREGLEDTLRLTSNRIKYYDVDLDFQEIPEIRANAAGLNQVWTNIILNAADSMGKKGSLKVECYLEDDEIVVRFTDTGPGIREEYLGKIFESNFSTKRSGAKFGLGLGLSISKDIVQQHGGTITAENGDDVGAIFTVRLPVHPEKMSS